MSSLREPSSLTMVLTKQRSLLPLLPLRLFAGWVFLTSGLSKASAGWLETPELAKVVTGWMHHGDTYRVFVPFLEHVVLPHQELFSRLVVWGEICVGLALLAGLLTRYASVGGLVMVTSYLLARGDGLTANPSAPFVAILITLALMNPGLALGVDAALKGKVPRWLS